MHFVKMQALGNDFVLLEPGDVFVKHGSRLAVKLLDRHRSIGGDGLILLLPSEVVDCKMIIYNADGSRAAMCGNGIRCLANYVMNRKCCDSLRVETDSGIRRVWRTVDECNDSNCLKSGFEGISSFSKNRYSVEMGRPDYSLSACNIDASRCVRNFVDCRNAKCGIQYICDCIGYSVLKLENGVTGIPVSMGNSHFVVDCTGEPWPDIERIGYEIEHKMCFTNRTNVEFARVKDREHVELRIWERGIGETLACGTGACATLAALYIHNKVDNWIKVSMKGGDLELSIREDGCVVMTGTSDIVFEGDLITDEEWEC